MAINDPRKVAITVEMAAIFKLSTNAFVSASSPKGSFQLSRVNCCQVTL
jgi:hypothetical protein